jgi:hypothetical protein
MPEDADEFRWSIVRRINNFLGIWRECSRPICKRARACRDKDNACARAMPALTPQQSARAAATMYRALQREIARRGLENDSADGEDAKDAPPPARRRR